MREGGKRRIIVPPGPLQQQGTKSLVWMVGLLDALEEAGGARAVDAGMTPEMGDTRGAWPNLRNNAFFNWTTRRLCSLSRRTLGSSPLVPC
jgi:hypothetical protein